MCSYISAHTVEGREWAGLINALGGPERAGGSGLTGVRIKNRAIGVFSIVR